MNLNLKENFSHQVSGNFIKQFFENYPDANAVVHAHSVFASTLSVLGKDIPAFHYMIAIAGGDSIRCAPTQCLEQKNYQ